MSPRTSLFFDAEAMKEAVQTSSTQSEAIRKLGQVAHADNYRRFREACARYGLRVPKRAPKVTKAGAGRSPGKFDDDDSVRRALETSSSAFEAIRAIGASHAGKNYLRLERRAAELGVRMPPRGKAGRPRSSPPVPAEAAAAKRKKVEALNVEDVQQMSFESRSQRELLVRLGLPVSRFNYTWMRNFAAENDIELPESLDNRGGIGIRDEEFFVVGARRNTGSLRARIAARNLIEHDRCKMCRLTPEWNGEPLTLHLDHINGDRADNRLVNLRFLCPNCHSQTVTYCKPKHLLPDELGVEMNTPSTRCA